MIGELVRVPLTDVWRNEPEFSRWLRDNIERLNVVLGMALSDPQCEGSVGDFSVDLVAEDESGHKAVIENQFGKSDHDHLGKLLTYLTNTEAAVAVWIVGEPRPEHVETITWLNEKPGARFYLVKLEAVRIADSPVAPLLTVIVGPGEPGGGVETVREQWAERERLRYEFFRQLLDRARARTKLHANVSPSTDSWVPSGSGTSGIHWTYRIRQRDVAVDLAIETPDGEANRQTLRKLAEQKEQVEASFGEPLEWDEAEGRQVCYVRKRLSVGGYRDEQDKWPAIQDAMVDAMIRLEKALRPRLAELPAA